MFGILKHGSPIFLFTRDNKRPTLKQRLTLWTVMPGKEVKPDLTAIDFLILYIQYSLTVLLCIRDWGPWSKHGYAADVPMTEA